MGKMSKNTKLLVGFLILVVLGLVGYLAYDFGTKSANSTQNPSSTQNTPSPNAYQTPSSAPSSIPTVNKQTVSAGGVLSFPNYSLLIPEGWKSEREQGQDMDKLTLTKLGYKMTISEGAFGGSGCVYPGDPPQEMAQTFTSFVEITNPNEFVFRRSSTGTGGWAVCQKGSGGSFGGPTSFGHISITEPSSPNASIVAEIDSILASLKKL